MPREKRGHSLSFNRSKTSPYPCSSSHATRSSINHLEPVEHVKEWEEARCPVCMDHPHNAVLLLCSSHEKGCRTYMCDTSHHHSNCFNQFCKSFAETPTMPPLEEASHTSAAPHMVSSEAMEVYLREISGEGSLPVPSLACESQALAKLMCPLCRGQVNEWVIVEPARQFMNAKARSCACETCDYSGTYDDLKKHARLEHPLVRPSEVDPERQRDWRRMERERDLGDVLSTIQSVFGEEGTEDSVLSTNGSMRGVLIFIQVSPSESGASNSWSRPSRSRGHSRTRRRMQIVPLGDEDHNSEIGSDAREGDNGSPEDTPGL